MISSLKLKRLITVFSVIFVLSAAFSVLIGNIILTDAVYSVECDSKIFTSFTAFVSAMSDASAFSLMCLTVIFIGSFTLISVKVSSLMIVARGFIFGSVCEMFYDGTLKHGTSIYQVGILYILSSAVTVLFSVLAAIFSSYSAENGIKFEVALKLLTVFLISSGLCVLFDGLKLAFL